MLKLRVAALLAATFLSAVLSSSAQAEPISLAILTTVGIAATATTVAVTSALLYAGVAIGASLLSSMLKGNQPADAADTSAGGASLNVQYGAALPRAAIMGPGAVGGHHVYTNLNNTNPGSADNDLLQCVFVIGDGQHGKLTRLRYNGKDISLPAGGLSHGEERICTEYIGPGVPGQDPGAGNPHLVIRYYSGRYDQVADANLILKANPAGRWTADHRGRGVAYLVVDQVYNEELQLTGIPSVLIETEGLVLYDPRKDSTNGGSGPHRWGQLDTYEPSANPAIQEYNYRRGILVNGQRILGMSLSPVNLILQMYFAAANDNDDPIALAEGGTEPRYRCSVAARDDRSHSDVLAAIRGSTAGWTLERGGQFGPISGVVQFVDSSMSFTDDDLIVGERATFTKYRSRSSLTTSVHGNFSNPQQFWVPAAFPAREDPADDAAIGEKLARQLDLSQVYSSSQAQRIAESERRRTLQNGQGTVTLPAKWIGVQPGDWLTYNSQRHGNMTILVTNTVLDVARHVVSISYERIANSVYSWTTAGELFPPDVGAGGAPGFIIMSATGMIATGINIPGDGGLMTPGIHFAWDPILDPSVDQIDFEIRKVGDTATLPFAADFPSSGSAVCSGRGIQAATNYEYRHKLYTTPIRNTPWSEWTAVTSGNQHIVPQAFTSIPGDVELASFEAGLRDYVGNQLGAAQEEMDRYAQLIANEAAEQDAFQKMERIADKTATTRLVEQVSAQHGKTWRGDWDADKQYFADDQVRFENELYYTPIDIKGIAPPAAPWVRLLNTAQISQEWITFAGDDGVVAQTSDRIEARFFGATVGGTPNDLPLGVATLIDRWAAYAGPDYAAAQTSESIEARFGSASPTQSLATVTSEWKAFAGANSATVSTHEQLTAAIGSNTVSITNTNTAVATIDGKLIGGFSIIIDANGYISGIRSYNDGNTSVFQILADNFIVAKPGFAGGAPIPAFVLSTNQFGAAKIVLNGDMIASGTITAGAIVAGSINAIHMNVGAINASNIIVDNILVTGHLIDGAASIRQTITTNAISPTSGNDNLVGQMDVEIKNTGRTIRVYLSLGNVNSIGGAIASSPPGTFVIKLIVDDVEQSRQNYTHDSGSGGFTGVWQFTKVIQTFFEQSPMTATVHRFKIFMDASGTTTGFPAGKMTVEEMRR